MAPQNEPALPREEEVLPHRLDPLEPSAVEPLGKPERTSTAVPRLDLEPLADERLKSLGRAMERIPFRHAPSVAPWRPREIA